MVVVEGKECQLRPAGSLAARTCHVVSLMRVSSHVRGEQRALSSRRLRLRTHACFMKDYYHLIVPCKSPVMHCALVTCTAFLHALFTMLLLDALCWSTSHKARHHGITSSPFAYEVE
jgi:hypothetical protein